MVVRPSDSYTMGRLFLAVFLCTILVVACATPRTTKVGTSAPALTALAGEIWPGKHWEKAVSSDAMGWSGANLAAADDFARTLQTDAYLLVHRGVLIHEYGAIARATIVHSVRKSLLSVLMGIYADRGMVDLRKTLADFAINDKDTLSVTERQATVQQLMQARSGVYHRAAAETPDQAAARPARGSFKPGDHWYYNNWDFNALGTIFKKCTGKSVFEALRDDLATPLQFEDFRVSVDTRWHYESVSEHPAYLMRLSARDLARVGVLMARHGRWRDRQIVSDHWVDESTTAYSQASPGLGYGYMWWVGVGRWHFQTQFPGKVYWARGNRGQFMVVDPVRDIVIVHRVNDESDNQRDVSIRQFGELLKRIMDAIKPAGA